ncbi:hypothetical protein TUM4249_03530 [Shewanella sp. KT0246]|nr:hypothetical protein TUM4249_03530 [Shewanella sp. KT0246]
MNAASAIVNAIGLILIISASIKVSRYPLVVARNLKIVLIKPILNCLNINKNYDLNDDLFQG